jgi:Tfp pilus assembly protein PilF
MSARVQAEKSARWIWVVTAVLVLLASSFVLFRRFIAAPIQNREILAESVSLAYKALESGDYGRAHDLFEKAHQLSPQDKSLYLYLGIIKIQHAEQVFPGKQLLEQIVNSEEYDPKRVWTGLGLASLHENDPKRAAEYLNKALSSDPLYQPAIINMGAVYLAKEAWSDAINQLLLAIKDGSLDGAEHLMMTEAIIKKFEVEKDQSILIDGIRILRNFIDKSKDYQFEAAIASTYLESLAGQKFDVIARVSQASAFCISWPHCLVTGCSMVLAVY